MFIWLGGRQVVLVYSSCIVVNIYSQKRELFYAGLHCIIYFRGGRFYIFLCFLDFKILLFKEYLFCQLLLIIYMELRNPHPCTGNLPLGRLLSLVGHSRCHGCNKWWLLMMHTILQSQKTPILGKHTKRRSVCEITTCRRIEWYWGRIFSYLKPDINCLNVSGITLSSFKILFERST